MLMNDIFLPVYPQSIQWHPKQIGHLSIQLHFLLAILKASTKSILHRAMVLWYVGMARGLKGDAWQIGYLVIQNLVLDVYGCIGCKCVLSLFDVHAKTCNVRLLQVVSLVHMTLKERVQVFDDQLVQDAWQVESESLAGSVGFPISYLNLAFPEVQWWEGQFDE